jgi:hypothetical protein
MSRFAAYIRSTAERLAVPQPARSRILLEMAADMEDLFALFLERGLDEEEARRRAVESFDLSDESLAELVAVHRNPVQRLLDSLSAEALARWEYALLTVLVLLTVLTSARLISGRQIFSDAGIFTWPVLLTGLAALAVAAAKFYQLHIKQDHEYRRAARGLNLLLRLVVLLPFLGFLGSGVGAARLLGDAEAASRPVAAVLLAWALQTTALLQISLGLGVLFALAWFLLAGKVGRIERDEAEILLRT